ncbi:MAG: PilZ domain-containing protein [Spirochaetia bacterium]|nr:PilZ domain-containing protein [Spirochaetia bacterium]
MTEGELYIEKRKHKRAYATYAVKYKLMPRENTMEAVKKEGFSKDISTGGLRIEGELIGNSGDIIKIEFKTENKDNPITAFAEIKWQKEIDGAPQFGLEFLALKEEDKEIIEKLSK